MKLNRVNKRGDAIQHDLEHAPAVPQANLTYGARFKGFKLVRGKIVAQWSIFALRNGGKPKPKSTTKKV